MFALEITFAGDASGGEMIFIRRPTAVIGSQDSAQVVVDDMRTLNYHLRISRELERRFRLVPVGLEGATHIPQFLDGVYDGEASVDLGPVKLRLSALDIDLLVKESEPPDRAGVRILRQATGGRGPRFPALVVSGSPPTVVSFASDQPVHVGRSRQCSLRIDVPSISSKHARVGYESGEFWVEDLGSTNGTFVNQQQISGRINVPSGVQISFGKEVSLVGVLSQDQLARAMASPSDKLTRTAVADPKFPILVSLSEAARPARIVLVPGSSFVLGRDPASDMWLGAPHISRRHCAVEMTKAGVVRIIDHSTNGTAYDAGILHKGDVAETTATPYVLDFGGNISVALCFNDKEEQLFTTSNGSPQTFAANSAESPGIAPKNAPVSVRARRTTTWLRKPGPISSPVSPQRRRFGALGQMYADLSAQGRMVMIAVVVGVAGIFTVIVSLLLPVLGK